MQNVQKRNVPLFLMPLLSYIRREKGVFIIYSHIILLVHLYLRLNLSNLKKTIWFFVDLVKEQVS